MRLKWKNVALVGAAGMAVLACLPGGAGAVSTRRVDPSISPGLSALAARSRADAQMRVIVEGDGAASAAASVGHVRKRFGAFAGVAATVRAADLDRLASQRGVSLVTRDAPVQFAAAGAVSTAGLASLYPGRDSASNPWNAGVTGQGVGIAVIDSGVTPSVDFGDRLVQVPLDGQTGSLDDTVGHGTMVAGVAAGHSPDGRFIGIAPGATVYALNVNRPSGVYASDVITALKWVFDHAHEYNIRVVNLSLTETVKSSYKLSVLDLAVERLWASGVFVVVAAGNRGAGQIDYAPANDPLVFTAGAFDTMGTSGPGDDTILPWSSSGKTMDGFDKPDLVAPGRHIEAPLPASTTYDQLAPAGNRVAAGYASINGTSFAAPQFAGAAAIIFQRHPDYSPDNVKWALIAKQGAKPRDSKVGALSLSSSYNLAGAPGRANQKVPALVCGPGMTCLTNGTVASNWDSSSWSASSWNGSTWSASSWNASSWSSTADWDASSWNASSWNASSWNATSWTADALFDLWS
jgi:serine protease AprX